MTEIIIITINHN